MRQKSQYDMVLLRKIFMENKMTSIEVGEMFGCCTRKASELRIELGFSVPKTLTCSYCGEEKAVNCFRSEFPEACIICRVKMGWEKPHQKAGPGRSKMPNKTVQLVKRKCLGLNCNKEFMTPLDCTGYPLNHFCPSHQKVNSFMGVEESYYGAVQTRAVRQTILRIR